MARLIEELQKPAYKFLTIENIPPLEVGIYEIFNFQILDDRTGQKVCYFTTDKGTYHTKSKSILYSLYGEIGNIFKSAFDRKEGIEVEIIRSKLLNGTYGLSFYTKI